MKKIMFVAAVLPLLGILPAGDTMQFSDWSTPVNLGPVVNSSYYDGCPTISKDGLSLYFRSDRPDPQAQGGFDIYVSQRDSLEDAWEAPINLGPTINGPDLEAPAAFSRDGHWMVFVSDRPGGCGAPSRDLWISHRQNKRDDFGWEPPANLGCVVNSEYDENGASFIEDEATGQLLLYFSSDRPGGAGLLDIYVSPFFEETRTFGPPRPAEELNTSRRDYQPTLRKDGLEVFFARGQPGWGIDLWVATRETTLDPWSVPVNLTSLNSTRMDYHPTLSWDGTTLIFASERVGTKEGETCDLFMSTRTKIKRQE